MGIWNLRCVVGGCGQSCEQREIIGGEVSARDLTLWISNFLQGTDLVLPTGFVASAKSHGPWF